VVCNDLFAATEGLLRLVKLGLTRYGTMCDCFDRNCWFKEYALIGGVFVHVRQCFDLAKKVAVVTGGSGGLGDRP